MRTKRLYRVVSVHPINGDKNHTYPKTRHFQSKGAAEESARRMRKGIPVAPWMDDEDTIPADYHVEPALSVRIDVSEPVIFPADQEER
ncbi:MAG: hypothetical protein ACRDTJ_09795 [Pseudonocardiaceae bacterium]